MAQDPRQSSHNTRPRHSAKTSATKSPTNMIEEEDLEIIYPDQIKDVLKLRPSSAARIGDPVDQLKKEPTIQPQKQPREKKTPIQRKNIIDSDIESDSADNQKQQFPHQTKREEQKAHSNIQQENTMLHVIPITKLQHTAEVLPKKKKKLDIQEIHAQERLETQPEDSKEGSGILFADLKGKKSASVLNQLIFDMERTDDQTQDNTLVQNEQTEGGEINRTPQKGGKKFGTIEFVANFGAHSGGALTPLTETRRRGLIETQGKNPLLTKRKLIFRQFLTGENYPDLFANEKKGPLLNLQNSRIKSKVHTIDVINSLDLGPNNTLVNLLQPENIMDNQRTFIPGYQIKQNISCNCQKTKCMKLYCDCFAAGQPCNKDQCKCQQCNNKSEFSTQREQTINNVQQKNPFAFQSQLEVQKDEEVAEEANDEEDEKLVHNKGCNCKKSNCLKKYCQCYNQGVRCSERCKCSECKNLDINKQLAANQMGKSTIKGQMIDTPSFSFEGNLFQQASVDNKLTNFSNNFLPNYAGTTDLSNLLQQFSGSNVFTSNNLAWNQMMSKKQIQQVQHSEQITQSLYDDIDDSETPQPYRPLIYPSSQPFSRQHEKGDPLQSGKTHQTIERNFNMKIEEEASPQSIFSKLGMNLNSNSSDFNNFQNSKFGLNKSVNDSQNFGGFNMFSQDQFE